MKERKKELERERDNTLTFANTGTVHHPNE